jgi:nucleosome binding factor SPN SPT16 subunit
LTQFNWKQAEWCYPPIIQSGGEYDLKPSAQSNSSKLSAGTIVTSFGIRYKSYCSNISRTILINPEEQKENDYKFLLELQKYVTSLIKPGIACSNLYESALAYVQEKRADLAPVFVKNLGFGTGIEFRDSNFLLGPKNSSILLKGMVLNFSIGFQNIAIKSGNESKGKVASI